MTTDKLNGALDELLPCPFCGATELERNDSVFWTGRKNEVTRYRIQHHCKGAQGRTYRHIEVAGTTYHEMSKAWNNRAPTLSQALGGGEAIYQIRNRYDPRTRVDVTKAEYDSSDDVEKRIVFTHPSPAAVPAGLAELTDEQWWRLFARLRDANREFHTDYVDQTDELHAQYVADAGREFLGKVDG